MGKFQLPEQFWTSKNDQNDDTLDYLAQPFNGIQWVEFPYQIHSETTSRVTPVSTNLVLIQILQQVVWSEQLGC